MENHRPDTVPSCRRGCVLSAGLGKVLTFLTHKIETFRSWKSKRFPPANHRRAGSYEPWRETDVSGSGSGRQNLDSFVPLGWVTISINMKTQMQRVGCQNQRHFEWCKLPQSVLCLATWYPCWSVLVALLSSSEHVPSLTPGELSPATGQLSIVKRVGKKRKRDVFPACGVCAAEGSSWWAVEGHGQKEMTLHIDLIWPTLETNHVPKRQVPRYSLWAYLQEWKMDNLTKCKCLWVQAL